MCQAPWETSGDLRTPPAEDLRGPAEISCKGLVPGPSEFREASGGLKTPSCVVVVDPIADAVVVARGSVVVVLVRRVLPSCTSCSTFSPTSSVSSTSFVLLPPGNVLTVNFALSTSTFLMTTKMVCPTTNLRVAFCTPRKSSIRRWLRHHTQSTGASHPLGALLNSPPNASPLSTLSYSTHSSSRPTRALRARI